MYDTKVIDMPILKPNAGETETNFISRCISDDKMKLEFPDKRQRSAVCMTSFSGKETSMDMLEDNLENEDTKSNDDYDTQTVPFEFKAINSEDDEEKGMFEGYGSIFGNKDLGNDVVEIGAFSKSLRKRKPKEVKLLWQHKQDQPIGVFESIKEDGDGLAVKGRLALGTQQGREAFELMKMGALDGLSIGYKADPNKQSYDERRKRRMLKEVDLMEISLVTFPMNPQARVTSVKACDRTIRDWETFLREEGELSRSDSKVCAKALVNTLTKHRDDGQTEISDAINRMKQLMVNIKPNK